MNIHGEYIWCVLLFWKELTLIDRSGNFQKNNLMILVGPTFAFFFAEFRQGPLQKLFNTFVTNELVFRSGYSLIFFGEMIQNRDKRKHRIKEGL